MKTQIDIVPVKLIYLDRAEGPTVDCVSKEFTSLDQADAQLYRWARMAPKKGQGYDKVDFKVIWEDGQEYSGRYDMNQQGEDDRIGHDIAAHIHGSLSFQAHKQNCPGYFKAHNDEGEDAPEARAWIAKYLWMYTGQTKKTWWCCKQEAK